MNACAWQPCSTPIDDETGMQERLLEVYRELYQRYFADELLLNHALPIETRFYRRSEEWGVCLLLTPWMLARLFITNAAPEIEPPPGWGAEERAHSDHLVIGPAVAFPLFQTPLKAHLNYHPRLGHYLVQPLIQGMQHFASADEAFAAWKEVIARRDRFILERNANCPWQKEVSRREFFTSLVQRTDADSRRR